MPGRPPWQRVTQKKSGASGETGDARIEREDALIDFRISQPMSR